MEQQEKVGIGTYILRALMFVFWLGLYLVAISIPQFYLLQSAKPEMTYLLIASIAIILVSLFFWWKFSHAYPNNARPLSKKDIIIDILIYVGLVLVKTVYGYLMEAMGSGGESTANDQALAMMLGTNPNIWVLILFIIMTVVAAPIIEEVIFRGYLRNYFFAKKSVILPMIISALLFSSFHLSADIFSFLLYAAMGAILYYAYYRNNNLNDAILVHFFNNFPAVIFIIYSTLFA